ncbi:hypothetical protein ACOSQ2_030932 [Xanthoceras sorbifolium]
MADEFNTGTNWWDSSSRNNRFDSGSSSSVSSGLNNNSLVSFGWATEMVDIKAAAARSSMDSSSVSGQPGPSDSPGSDLHMMGLGLSSPSLDWNHTTLLRGDKSESGFRSMLQENLNSSSGYEFKQINRGFSLDHHHHHQPPQFSDPHHQSSSDSSVTCQGLQASSFQMDTSTLYHQQSPPTIYQGLLGSDHNNNQQPVVQVQQQQQSSFDSNRSSSMNNYQFGTSSYGMNNTNDHHNNQILMPSWSSTKVPQFLRTSPTSSSPPKQTQQQQQHQGQLHFSNNTTFWNASAGSCSINNDARSSFFPSLQTPLYSTQTFDEKPKHNISEVRDSNSAVKKSGSEPASKRPRNETTSNMPAFKVRKEKMGDRITALQQLVSPFGKTDTASVLSEAIEYIKFLHEQVAILSTPYMKSEAAIQHQQNSDKSKDSEGPKQDLRSRGLCLVPVSSTFPVTHETTVDFWTPTFGGTYR